jgi:hypothetical protein
MGRVAGEIEVSVTPALGERLSEQVVYYVVSAQAPAELGRYVGQVEGGQEDKQDEPLPPAQKPMINRHADIYLPAL